MNKIVKKYDVVIIGGGAAGFSVAAGACLRGRGAAVLDMGNQPLRKVSASGGGKCNLTNDAAITADRYFGKNPKFAMNVLGAVRPDEILDWARAHKIHLSEAAPGRYFADNADNVVRGLLDDARAADLFLNVKITDIKKLADGNFQINDFISSSVVVATGGISFPTMGVSDIGFKIAKKFGHKIVPPRPGLVGLKTDVFPAEFAGMSMTRCTMQIGKKIISDSLLFTHRGIGGPLAYRASLYDLGQGAVINFCPDSDVSKFLIDAKKSNPKKAVSNILNEILQQKFARWIAADLDKNIADYSDKVLLDLGAKINRFYIKDVARLGLESAEVMAGGIDTDDINPKTLESKLCKRLFFAGEVVDITGDLGGFNLHWAFASGCAAGRYC